MELVSKLNSTTLMRPHQRRIMRIDGRLAVALIAFSTIILLAVGVYLATPAYALAAAIFVLVVGVVANLILIRGRRGFLDPSMALAAVTVPFFILAPFVQLLVNQYSQLHVSDPVVSFVITALMVGTFIVVFSLGRRLAKYHNPGKRSLASDKVVVIVKKLGRLRIIVWTLLIIGAISWFFYFQHMGGIVYFLKNLQNKTQLQSGLGYLLLLSSSLQIGALIAVTCDANNVPVMKRSLLWVTVSVALILIMSLGGRSRVLMFLVVILFIFKLTGRHISAIKWGVILVVGVVFLFLAGRIRTLGYGGDEIFDYEAITEVVNVETEMSQYQIITDYGHFERIGLIYEYVPSKLPFQYGATIVSVALFPLPRSFFPDKPIGSGPLLANAFNPGSWDLERGWVSGVTPTIIGELYLNFWWPGVIIGGLILGWIASKAFSAIKRNRTIWAQMIYSLYLVYFVMAGVLGEFYGTVIAFTIFLSLVLGARMAFRLGNNRRQLAKGLP